MPRTLAAGRWLALAMLVTALCAAGCAGQSDAEPVTETPTAMDGAGQSDAEPVAETPAATDDQEAPMRWGYDPFDSTGLEDPPIPEAELPDDYRVEQVVGGLTMPTHLAVLPDGRVLVTEQTGDVRVIDDGTLLDEPFFTVEDAFVPELEGVVELGLTGVAVDRDFQQHPFVYVYHHSDGPRRSAVTRLRIEDGAVAQAEEIFSFEAEPTCCHVGGGMDFLPDGTILIGMGDHQRPREAQDPLTPNGSVMRMQRDGSWPADNPFISWTYAYGLRNPYDVTVDPVTGRILSGENGFFGQDAILEIKEGANYGWPGFGLRPGEIEEPLTFYHEQAGTAGMDVYQGDLLTELVGVLVFCRFHTGSVHAIEFAEDGSVAREVKIAEPCHTDIETGPDGGLLFLDYAEGAVYRLGRG